MQVQFGQIDVGQVVAGKYELVRLLGKGAMGEVWLAKHASLGGEFAIKLVRPEAKDADESAIARFQQEAQVSAKLSRKTRHIVSVIDHGEENGLAYLVMELLEGESLETRIDRRGQLDVPETVSIVTQIARALGQAHAEQIVHRDLKPANVFLTQDEDGRLLVKLLDFGIARAAGPDGTRSPFATGKDMVLGTPSYMSPEQARGLPSLDHRCDLWALAVVGYEALTRTIPWDGETIEDIFLSICTHAWTPVLNRRPDLPPELEAFFARSFADNLNARFSTAAELSEAFVTLAGSSGTESVRANAPSAPELAMPPSSVPSEHDVGADLHEASVGEPTTRTRNRRATIGWLIAAALGLATIGILGFALVSFNAPATDKTKPAPPEPVGTKIDQPSIPPPEAPTASAVITTGPTGSTKGPVRPSARPTPGTPAPPTPTPTAEPPPPPVAPTPPPVATTPPSPPPPPPPSARPPPDKSQVF